MFILLGMFSIPDSSKTVFTKVEPPELVGGVSARLAAEDVEVRAGAQARVARARARRQLGGRAHRAPHARHCAEWHAQYSVLSIYPFNWFGTYLKICIR